MSKLDELIQHYCPNGVEFKPLKDVCINICSGGTPNSKNPDYYGGEHPWLRTQEVVFGPIEHTELTITDEGLKNSSAKYIPPFCVIVAMYGATVGRVGYNTIPLTTNQACCNLEIDSKQAAWKYIYYCLTNKYEEIKSKGQGSQTNINAGVVKSIEIPIPPIPVQEEIVRILDEYSELEEELEANLEAELDMRKKQYEYYRDKMLSLEGYEGEVEYKTLDEIATNWFRGSGIKRDEVTEDGQSCIRYGEIYTTYGLHFDSCVSHTSVDVMPNPKVAKPGAILFAITGESVEDIAMSTAYLGDKDIYVGGDILVMEHEQDAKYLAYALSTTDARKQKSKGRIKSKVVHSNKNDISQIVIPIPKDINEQKRIADVLDRFYNLINDISEALPAEIKMRHQQYEYYRDKLLNFKRLEVAANA